MIAEAINKIAEITRSSDGKIIEIDGKKFSTTPLLRVPSVSTPKALEFNTLGGLAGYIESGMDKSSREIGQSAIFVEGPDLVTLRSALGGDDMAIRACFATCKPTNKPFQFGQFIDHESMLIALQAQFTAAGSRAELLALLGNIRDEHVRNVGDDGVTQEVTAKSGVALVKSMAVPNPVHLAPFRTFAEVEQPVSPFVLRVRSGREKPEIGLFEADGGAWRLDAIKRVATWLQAALPTANIFA